MSPLRKLLVDTAARPLSTDRPDFHSEKSASLPSSRSNHARLFEVDKAIHTALNAAGISLDTYFCWRLGKSTSPAHTKLQDVASLHSNCNESESLKKIIIEQVNVNTGKWWV